MSGFWIVNDCLAYFAQAQPFRVKTRNHEALHSSQSAAGSEDKAHGQDIKAGCVLRTNDPKQRLQPMGFRPACAGACASLRFDGPPRHPELDPNKWRPYVWSSHHLTITPGKRRC
ncbi:uncharacterized protein PV09_00331 [Verruconis gallopava]|uniref:Uncharacterized protein n=1 Tax=Verruconis gallopava TaxID=253628 RepID=A0A0D1Y379_9PEZI|nr:uncharacterized protein PV09_00331 [Verruconis gallopava]KIW09451.1 hypothetical protein PV09_00331 [Verruconis gallopava]